MITILFWLLIASAEPVSKGRDPTVPPSRPEVANVAQDGINYRYLCRGDECKLISTQPIRSGKNR